MIKGREDTWVGGKVGTGGRTWHCVKKNNDSDHNIIIRSRDFLLSHNNPCFQRNIAITNFLASHTCEIRFNDVIGLSTIHMYF